MEDWGKQPIVDMGKIFCFILKHKEFGSHYIDKYKTEKAYSDFDSKFIGPILCHVMEDSDTCFLNTENLMPHDQNGYVSRQMDIF